MLGPNPDMYSAAAPAEGLLATVLQSFKQARASRPAGDDLTAATTASPTTSGVSRLRVSPCSRLAVLTVSPITVNEMLCSLPTSPITAGP